MKLKKREKSELAVLSSVAKSALSNVPLLNAIIGGYDGYKRHLFENSVEEIISHFRDKLDNINDFFSDEWVKSESGQRFIRKVIDCTLDAQLEDKRELFINALINGVRNKEATDLEKLKFVDMLRQLSRASLNVLADLHNIYKNQVRRPGQEARIDAAPHVNRDKIVEKLSHLYEPYLIESTFEELKSVGLFSPNITYFKRYDGTFHVNGYMSEGNYAYTDYTCRFVEFITLKDENKGQHTSQY